MMMSSYQTLLQPIHQFLQAATPDEWLLQAAKPQMLAILLTDHLLCELKAAQTAMWLIRKYAVDKASADALLRWLAPYEDFAYRKKGSLQTLKAGTQGLTKSIKARP